MSNEAIANADALRPRQLCMPAAKVGVGVTVLQRALAHRGHLDGIGTYTRALIDQYRLLGVPFEPCQFPVSGPIRDSISGTTVLKQRFAVSAVVSALTGLPFPGWKSIEREICLFHATDHLIPKLNRVPVLANVMDPIPLTQSDWIKNRFSRAKSWLFRRSTGWADHYLTISSFVAQDLAERMNVSADRISAIHLGVDDIYFERAGETEKIQTLNRLKLRPGFFLFVGTLQPRKNVGTLIDAFERLPLAMRQAHPLVVVGRSGWRADAEIERLAQLQASGTGFWLDYVADADKRVLMQTAAALVFPSLYEGFGLPVLEAFASGLPVVASNTTSIPEVAGDAAELVDPLDAEALAFAMTRIVEDSALAQELSCRGMLRAREFTWANTAIQTAALYRELAG
jgi:glycosyltransferase involved in cell wall biosynthesis